MGAAADNGYVMFTLTPLPPGIVVILLPLLVGAAGFDIAYRRIPNWLTASGVVAGLWMNTFLYQGWPGVRQSLAGLALGFGAYFALYMLRAMGAGDVKLMAAVGAMVGWQNWIAIFVLTALMGGLAAMGLIAMRKRIKKTFWNVGFVLTEMKSGRPAYLKNEELDVRSGKSMGLPHGAVIAAAVMAFIVVSVHFAE